LRLCGTRAQYSKDNENEFHGDPIIARFKQKPRAWLIASSRLPLVFAFGAAVLASVAAIAHAGSALPPAASSTLLRARRCLREVRTEKGYQTEHRYCRKQFRHFLLPRACPDGSCPCTYTIILLFKQVGEAARDRGEYCKAAGALGQMTSLHTELDR
jgi:hypothetical protein